MPPPISSTTRNCGAKSKRGKHARVLEFGKESEIGEIVVAIRALRGMRRLESFDLEAATWRRDCGVMVGRSPRLTERLQRL